MDPADAIVTHDSGSPREQLLPFYRATRPRGYLGWGKSHQLGTGLGLTIGAKVAAPDRFCVNFMGDAAFGMTGLDFETAVRCGVPICTIVLNNSAMAIEIPHMKLSHERYRSRDLGGSYANLATRSRRVERARGGSVAGGRGDPARAARRPRRAGRACWNLSPARRRRSRGGSREPRVHTECTEEEGRVRSVRSARKILSGPQSLLSDLYVIPTSDTDNCMVWPPRHGGRRPAIDDFADHSEKRRGWPAFGDHDGVVDRWVTRR